VNALLFGNGPLKRFQFIFKDEGWLKTVDSKFVPKIVTCKKVWLM
jgi:hypothetical protein